jgi:methylmalonyl-CoA mutase
VNTFLSAKGSPTITPQEVIRATTEEKEYQIKMLKQLHAYQHPHSSIQLEHVQMAAIQNKNIFSELMEATKVCSLGQLTKALFEVGGQYRRNM